MAMQHCFKQCRRCPTAGRSNDGFHGGPSWHPRGGAMVAPLVREPTATADLQRSADCPVYLLRSFGQASRSGTAVGSGAPGGGPAPGDPARVRGELAGLWGAQDLAAAGPRGLRCRAMHCGATDESSVYSKGYTRQAAPDNDPPQESALSIGQGEPAVPGVRTQQAVTSHMSPRGRGLFMSHLAMVIRTRGIPMARSSTPVPVASSAGGAALRHMRVSFPMFWNRPSRRAAAQRAWALSVTATGAANICRSNTATGWPKRASSPRSEAWMTVMTMLWPRP